jgi:hypothetical protein
VGFLNEIPTILLILPIALLFLDLIYKWFIFKHPPYDTVADMALGALTFCAVHVFNKLLPIDQAMPVKGRAFLWVFAQFAAWPMCMAWAARLERRKARWELYLSYLLGVAGFVVSTGKVLQLVP